MATVRVRVGFRVRVRVRVRAPAGRGGLQVVRRGAGGGRAGRQLLKVCDRAATAP